MGLELLLKRERIVPYFYHDILTGVVDSEEQGISVASSLLDSLVDTRTVLYLSGGRTPKQFYEVLSREERLFPAAVGLIDERYGMPYHENSNELMIQSTGFLRYFQMRDIRFCPILRGDASLEETAESYDALVRSLHSTFPRSVGVMGIGLDGHTAGIPARVPNTQYPNLSISENDFVTSYNYTNTVYGERVTMTFLGLSVLDVLLVLVFGKEKRKALELIFTEGSEEDVPGRFYKRADIARKTVLITDIRL